MNEENVVVRLKLGENEIEIGSRKEDLKEEVEVLQDLLGMFVPQAPPRPTEGASAKEAREVAREMPEIKVKGGESLPSVILKMFSTPWGRKPRRLIEVKEALESYGLIYPKQSVAVALLRLAKAGKLRRFKGAGEEYVYTASMELLAER